MGILESVQPNPAQSTKRNGLQLTIALILVIILSVIGLAWNGLRPAGGSNHIVNVVIPPASGLSGAAKILKEESAIRSIFWFQLYATLTGARSQIQAGSYAIEQNESVSDILKQLKTGKRGDELTLKVIEGWTEDQVVAELNKIGLKISEPELDTALQIMVTADKGGDQKYAALFEGVTDSTVGTLTAEGYLYPDTYKVFTNATPTEILTKMLDNMKSKLTAEDITSLQKSNYSFYQILTIASIVEREVSVAADRKVVGGIFLRRLADTYPLQSDATVNYVTGKKTTTPSFADTKVQSAYNTYQHPGLPPTPISNPSITAIQGVLHPVASEYYFFLTTKEGKAVYSKTYDEHLKYKQQYYGN